MASVTFKRGTRAEIEATAKQDGQILMETDQNKKNKMYIDLPDGRRVLIGNSGEAIDTSYDNTTSGLDATNVQNAIDKIENNVGDIKGQIDTLNSNLESKQPTITGGATTITDRNLTASRALVSNSNGKVAVSAVTSTELGYLDGVKSAIQTQLNDKLSKTGGTMTGALNLANGVWNKVGDDAYFGDNNVSGHMCIKPQATGKPSGLRLQNFEETNHVSVYNDSQGRLILEATGGGIFLPTSNAVYVSNASNTARAPIYASDFVKSSSRRLKENIEDMTEEEAKKLLLLNPVTYDYINKDNGTDCKGLIAEDTVKIIPSCVVGNVDCADDDESALQGIGIDYSNLVPYLIKMVQIQQGEIDVLKNQILS